MLFKAQLKIAGSLYEWKLRCQPSDLECHVFPPLEKAATHQSQIFIVPNTCALQKGMEFKHKLRLFRALLSMLIQDFQVEKGSDGFREKKTKSTLSVQYK